MGYKADTISLATECAKSAQCIGFKHHFDECVERVTSAQENPDPKAPHEDCVEECKPNTLCLFFLLTPIGHILIASAAVFHLQHCATQCAAPKLWKQLK